MWIVSKLSVEARNYFFESSGQGKHEDLALLADGLELANMLRLTDWGDDPAQVVICDSCGTVDCASGNYVALRRLEDFVVWAPPGRGYAESADPSEMAQYREPHFVRKRGVPLVSVEKWERLRAQGVRLPDPDRLAPLRWSEVLLAAQLEAPHRLLGEPGRRPSRRLTARVEATDPWIEPETLDRLGYLDAWDEASASSDAQIIKDAHPVSLILDEGGLQELVLFAKAAGGYGLWFEPGLVLQPSEHGGRATPSHGTRKQA